MSKAWFYENFFKCFMVIAVIGIAVGAGVQTARLDATQEQLNQVTLQANSQIQQADRVIVEGTKIAIATRSPEVKQAFAQVGFPVEKVEELIAQAQAKQDAGKKDDLQGQLQSDFVPGEG
jgi:hypothetical protein